VQKETLECGRSSDFLRVNPLRIDSSQFLHLSQSLANDFHFSGRLKTVVQQPKGKL
jgi:hypothetical protein